MSSLTLWGGWGKVTFFFGIRTWRRESAVPEILVCSHLHPRREFFHLCQRRDTPLTWLIPMASYMSQHCRCPRKQRYIGVWLIQGFPAGSIFLRSVDPSTMYSLLKVLKLHTETKCKACSCFRPHVHHHHLQWIYWSLPQMRSASVSRFWRICVFLVSGTHQQKKKYGRTHFHRRRENTTTDNSHSHFHMGFDISFLVLSPHSLSLSLTHTLTNTSTMTQAGRMCFLSAQLSSGSPRHEITGIRDDCLSN